MPIDILQKPPRPGCNATLTIEGQVFQCVKAKGHRHPNHRTIGSFAWVNAKGLVITLEHAIEWSLTVP